MHIVHARRIICDRRPTTTLESNSKNEKRLTHLLWRPQMKWHYRINDSVWLRSAIRRLGARSLLVVSRRGPAKSVHAFRVSSKQKIVVRFVSETKQTKTVHLPPETWLVYNFLRAKGNPLFNVEPYPKWVFCVNRIFWPILLYWVIKKKILILKLPELRPKRYNRLLSPDLYNTPVDSRVLYRLQMFIS